MFGETPTYRALDALQSARGKGRKGERAVDRRKYSPRVTIIFLHTGLQIIPQCIYSLRSGHADRGELKQTCAGRPKATQGDRDNLLSQIGSQASSMELFIYVAI